MDNKKTVNPLKRFARAVLPRPAFERLAAVRSRRYQLALLQREGLIDAAAHFIEQYGTTVKYGPFSGMIYPLSSALARHSIPKLLGTYEEELHEIVTEILSRKYDIILDIGSAEGYYAVGLARKLQTTVLAFDPEPLERGYCLELAKRNGVSDLVQLRNLFQSSDIADFSDKRALCVCDCEGFEEHLFNETTVRQTIKWDLLIELHGDASTKVKALKWPHRTVTIAQASRDKMFKELDGIGDRTKLLSEGRTSPCNYWLWCDGSQNELL